MVGFRHRVEEARGELRRCGGVLDDMERAITLTTSPALSPERRRPHAVRTAELLDSLHASHRALAFIGQSYTHLAGSSLARNRFLETVDQVESWRALHQGIVDSHRVNVEFLDRWLSYMEALCRPDLLKKLEAFDGFSEEGLLGEIEGFLEKFFTAEEEDLLSPSALCLSDLLCRVDLLRQPGVSPELLWNAARFLGFQGRPYEARLLLQRAYGLLAGSEASPEIIARFFLDWARVEGSNDLIRVPQYELAFQLLDNVRSLAPDLAEEAGEEKRHILQAQREYFAAARFLQGWNLEVQLMQYRNAAQDALEAQDLPQAFAWVRKMEEGLDRFPDVVRTNFLWLAKTALACRGAVDPAVDQACEEALLFLWGLRDRLRAVGFVWDEEWVAFLRDQGIAVEILETLGTSPSGSLPPNPVFQIPASEKLEFDVSAGNAQEIFSPTLLSALS